MESTRRWVLALVCVMAAVGTAATVGVLVDGPASGRGTTVLAVTSSNVRPSTTTTTTTTVEAVTPLSDLTTTSPPPPTPPPVTTPSISDATRRPAPPQPGRQCAPVKSLSVSQQAHLVQMVGVSGGDITRVRRLLTAAAPVGGVFVGGDDDSVFADGSLRQLTASVPSIVAVDDEGGRVQRIDKLVGDLPPAAAQATMSASSLRQLAAQRAGRLRGYGVKVDFAPVVDVADPASGGVIGDRSFGPDVDAVTDHARAVVDGMIDGGVVPTLKHFPGHGAGSGDSHKGTVNTPALAQLEQRDLRPYRELARSDVWVMVGHLDVPDLTEPGRPASLSPAAYNYLRGRIGFRGIAVTDELGGMRAVSSRFAPATAGVLALQAGADVLLYADASHVNETANAIVAAVLSGTVPALRLAEAAARVRAAQGC